MAKRKPSKSAAHCPTCGGPRHFRDADRECESCRLADGKFAALDLALRLRKTAPHRLEAIAEWPVISELCCELFKHPKFVKATAKRLKHHLQMKLTERLPSASVEDVYRLPLAEVVKMLRKVTGDGIPPGNRHSADFRSVLWDGIEYAFTSNQAAVVRLLWEARENETPDVSGDYLAEAADTQATDVRMSVVFRDNAAWGAMIVEGKTKGSYRLK